MFKKILPLILLIWNNTLSQQISLFKQGEKKVGDNASVIYGIRIYNNTDKPICIPVSNYFAYRMTVNDTLELGNISDEKDTIIVISLSWSKQDLETDPQQMPSYPVVINPRTYLLTNIRFVKKPDLRIRKIYFEFKHSFGPDLDYEQIISSYNTEPKFRWKKSLKFIETQVPVEL